MLKQPRETHNDLDFRMIMDFRDFREKAWILSDIGSLKEMIEETSPHMLINLTSLKGRLEAVEMELAELLRVESLPHQEVPVIGTIEGILPISRQIEFRIDDEVLTGVVGEQFKNILMLRDQWEGVPASMVFDPKKLRVEGSYVLIKIGSTKK